MVRRGLEPAVVILAGVLALAGLGRLWRVGGAAPPVDFFSLYAGSRLAAGDGSGFYSADSAFDMPVRWKALAGPPASPREAATAGYWRHFELTGSPFFEAAGRVLTAGSFESAYLHWRLLSLVALMAALALLGWLAGFSPALSALLFAFTTLSFEPVASDVRVGTSTSCCFF